MKTLNLSRPRLSKAAAVSLCCAVLAISGCARDINPRGNLPPDEALSELKPGEQTRQDVQVILGTPSHVSSFHDETWYYISSRTSQYAFYPIEEMERQIYALDFDERGVLQDIRTLGLEDGQNVALVERETPTMGREFSLIEQLIGNLGRFDRGRPEEGP